MKVISVLGVLAAAAVFMASCVSQPFNLGVHNPEGFAGIRGGDSSVLSRYIQFVLNPKMKEVGNSVRLENERYILVYEPELAYSLTDKETGIISEGRAGFTANIFLTEGKVYLLEADLSVLSIGAFLASNYAEDAQVVLVPVECSAGEVTYVYERPLELRGDRVTFSITEIQKQ